MSDFQRGAWSDMQGGVDAKVGLLAIPFDGATSFRKGAAEAIDALREFSQHTEAITEEGRLLTGFTLHDYGSVPRDLNWERYFAAVTQRAGEVLTGHPFALFIGGDHSVTIPLQAAFHQWAGDETWGILHIDAHPDLVDQYEGHRWSHACTERRALELPGMSSDRLVMVGIRSWIAEEVTLVQQQQIAVHSARSVYQRGVQTVARDVIAQLSGLKHIYLTLDIDCLDPAYAPGTGTPESGGLTTRELIEFLRLVFADLPIRAMDVVEIAPRLDYSGITTVAALKVLYEVFGWLMDKQPDR